MDTTIKENKNTFIYIWINGHLLWDGFGAPFTVVPFLCNNFYCKGLPRSWEPGDPPTQRRIEDYWMCNLKKRSKFKCPDKQTFDYMKFRIDQFEGVRSCSEKRLLISLENPPQNIIDLAKAIGVIISEDSQQTIDGD